MRRRRTLRGFAPLIGLSGPMFFRVQGKLTFPDGTCRLIGTTIHVSQTGKGWYRCCLAGGDNHQVPVLGTSGFGVSPNAAWCRFRNGWLLFGHKAIADIWLEVLP